MHAEVIQDGLPFDAFLFGDADVGMAEHHPADAPPYQGAAAGETGFVGDVGRGHRPVAEAQRVLLRVAGVQAALTWFAAFRRAVRHARQRAVEARRRDAPVRAEQHRAHLQPAAGPQAAELQRHVHEDFILELRTGHGNLGVGLHHGKNPTGHAHSMDIKVPGPSRAFNHSPKGSTEVAHAHNKI